MRNAISRVPASMLLVIFTACCSTQRPNGGPPPPPVAGGHVDTPCDHQPHDNIMKADNGVASCESVEVSMSAQNFVMWHARQTEHLTVTFTGVNPFQHVDCVAHVCIAFGIIPASGTYDYALSIDGKKSADPNIIIRP